MENQTQKSGDFLNFFFSLQAIETPQKNKFNFNFKNFLLEKTELDELRMT
jgi:hypothetical protein